MTSPDLQRILIVDDEEAILETMTFTFMDAYEVLTSSNARAALEIFDDEKPIAVVITDQRMPDMTGVEFLKEVYARHPETIRIMLTGFADSESTIQAINDGHIYAYVNKPWEPVELKQVVARAVELHRLTVENQRLVEILSRGNLFLEAVMDRLETGAIAVDAADVVQAANRAAREFFELERDPRGDSIGDVLAQPGLENVGDAVARLSGEDGDSFEETDVQVAATPHRLRITVESLEGASGEPLGRVLFLKEISHEPLRRLFEEELSSLSQHEDAIRARFQGSLGCLAKLHERVEASGITSPSMARLSEQVSRTLTAIQGWLGIDDVLGREEYPDAQLLVERMRLSNQRWPRAIERPARVQALSKRVEAYYESGENPKQRVL
jgi:CheY-like chemotaxis protein